MVYDLAELFLRDVEAEGRGASCGGKALFAREAIQESLVFALAVLPSDSYILQPLGVVIFALFVGANCTIQMIHAYVLATKL